MTVHGKVTRAGVAAGSAWKRIKEKQALKRAKDMAAKWAAEDAAKSKKPKPKAKPKSKPKEATEAGGTALEEGRRMGIYKKKKKKKKNNMSPGGAFYKP